MCSLIVAELEQAVDIRSSVQLLMLEEADVS